ncbi:MAG: barstar family protein [Oscillospiraceae bacterium]|nr:barstar family protein [Oscillospiraceae bacterium]
MLVTIDCAAIQDRADFHKVFSSKLRLPAYYGNNLDALYDCLTTLPEQTTLNLHHMQKLIDNLGSYGRAALNMIARAERENPERLTVNMR